MTMTSYSPNAERQLWAAVILTALDDAVGSTLISHPKQRETAKREARSWFVNASRDFQMTCYLAGVLPAEVRKRAIAMFEEVDRTGKRPRKNATSHQPKAAHHIPLLDQQLTHNGETLPIREWITRTGTPEHRLRSRIKQGWSVTAAVFAPKQQPLKMLTPLSFVKTKTEKQRRAATYTHDGLTLTVQEWAEHLGIPYRTIRTRIACGWPLNRVFSKYNYRGKSRKKAQQNAIAA